MKKCKISELKCGNRKLFNVWKYNQERLFLAFFHLFVCNKLVLKDIKQAPCN